MTDQDDHPATVPKSTKEEAFNPPSKLIGQAFRGITHKLLDPLVKINIIKDKELEDFHDKIENKTDNIPCENRDSSELGLTYKAFEDSPYQLNEEILRDMFANIISSTVDNRVNTDIRPSFSSILKDLSSDEANLFKVIYQEENLPIGSIIIKNEVSFEGIDMLNNVVLMEEEFFYDESSLDTLKRFGLINIDPNTKLVANKYKKRYEQFEEGLTFNKYKSQLPIKTDEHKFDSIELTKGNVSITAFGKDFGNIVI